MLKFDTRHFTVCLVIGAIFAWLSITGDMAVKACKAKGVQSDATCETYAR